MGVDDDVCETAADGAHDFQITEVTGNSRAGLALIHQCACGAISYEATADDRRPPL